MNTLLHRSARFLAGLAPCALCRRRAARQEGICSACSTRLWERLEPRVSERGGVALLSLGRFDGPIRTVVHEIKFGGRVRLAVAAGRHLGSAIRQAGWPVARVVPVPLHPGRRRERGFNQAHGIARGVGQILDSPPWRGVARVRATGRQARVVGPARRRNVEGAFVSKPLPPLPVVLIDDVWTTGATARACRKVLLDAGAREVRVAVIACARGRSVRAQPIDRETSRSG